MAETNFRGKRVTDKMVLGAMLDFDRDFRTTFTKWRRFAIERDGKLYPPKHILSMTTGMDPSEFGGGHQTNRVFEELGFKVITVGPPPPPEEDAMETALSFEKDLEDFLAARVEQLEPGLRLYEEQGLVGRQLNAAPVGRIDLLAVDKTGNLLVIELKAGEADDQACGQVLGYMGWIKENIARGRGVRGMIVANEFTERLRAAVKALPALSLKKYDVSFRFSDVK